MMAHLAANVLAMTGLRRVLGAILPRNGLLVLNYHRIGDGTGSVFDRGLWSANPADFEEQIDFLKQRLTIISPADIPGAIARGQGRYGMITFDDGYRDNYEVAFPALRRAGLSAVFFVSTGFVDKPAIPWWDEIAWMVRRSTREALSASTWTGPGLALGAGDREDAIRTVLRAFKRTQEESHLQFMDWLAEATGAGRYSAGEYAGQWMTWDMLREMQKGGMVIGGHTVSHPVLSRCSAERQREEIAVCGRRLNEELGRTMECFSYPVGGSPAFDSTTSVCLREAGVRYAFSYYGGFNRFSGWNDYDIRRVPVETTMTTDCFKAVVDLPGWFA